MTTFTVKPSGVPAGTYRGKFVAVEDTAHPEYGAGLRWSFKIVAGATSVCSGRPRHRRDAHHVRNTAGRCWAVSPAGP